MRLPMFTRQAPPIRHHVVDTLATRICHVAVCALGDDVVVSSLVLRCGRSAPPSADDRGSPGLSEQDVSPVLIHSA